MALGVPGRLRPRIFSTTRVVGRQPNATAAFIPGEIPGTHFQRLSRPQGTWFCRKATRKVTPPGIDPGTVRLVMQRLNHYATPRLHFTSITNDINNASQNTTTTPPSTATLLTQHMLVPYLVSISTSLICTYPRDM